MARTHFIALWMRVVPGSMRGTTVFIAACTLGACHLAAGLGDLDLVEGDGGAATVSSVTSSASVGGPGSGGAGGCGFGCGGSSSTGGTGGSEPSTGGGGLAPCSTYPNAQPFTVNGEEHCYWLVSTATEQSSAQATCEDDGGYLATVHSQGENDHVRALAAAVAPGWIGLRCDVNPASSCQGIKANYSWLTGEAFGFDGWASGEPGPGRGVAIHADGSWQSGLSTNAYAFICEAGTLIP